MNEKRKKEIEEELKDCLSMHGPVQNLFLVGRHLLRTRAFVEWDTVTCAC